MGGRGTSQKRSSHRAGLLPSPCPPQPGRKHSLRAPHPPDPWAECSQALHSCLGFTLDTAGSVSQRPSPILPPRGAGAVQSHPLGSVCLWCHTALHKRSFVPLPGRALLGPASRGKLCAKAPSLLQLAMAPTPGSSPGASPFPIPTIWGNQEPWAVPPADLRAGGCSCWPGAPNPAATLTLEAQHCSWVGSKGQRRSLSRVLWHLWGLLSVGGPLVVEQ